MKCALLLSEVKGLNIDRNPAFFWPGGYGLLLAVGEVQGGTTLALPL
jgi:hypothetical protein